MTGGAHDVPVGDSRDGVGAKNIRSSSASLNRERLGALVLVLLDSNRSLLQSCTIIYNDERKWSVSVEKSFAVSGILKRYKVS
jgi:hypothetical protein